MVAFANSSWYWFTRNPLPLLPWAMVGTLIVEVFVIHHFNQIKMSMKTVVIVFLGNITSFLTPHIFVGIVPEIFEENANFFSRINSMADMFPFYIVGLAFLLLILIVETPVVIVGLMGNTNNKKRLASIRCICRHDADICIFD